MQRWTDASYMHPCNAAAYGAKMACTILTPIERRYWNRRAEDAVGIFISVFFDFFFCSFRRKRVFGQMKMMIPQLGGLCACTMHDDVQLRERKSRAVSVSVYTFIFYCFFAVAVSLPCDGRSDATDHITQCLCVVLVQYTICPNGMPSLLFHSTLVFYTVHRQIRFSFFFLPLPHTLQPFRRWMLISCTTQQLFSVDTTWSTVSLVHCIPFMFPIRRNRRNVRIFRCFVSFVMDGNWWSPRDGMRYKYESQCSNWSVNIQYLH